tara:strand:+ start:159 stop:269 length:111 start_codon:yes stop_codon:yes gene_type:complete
MQQVHLDLQEQTLQTQRLEMVVQELDKLTNNNNILE